MKLSEVMKKSTQHSKWCLCETCGEAEKIRNALKKHWETVGPKLLRLLKVWRDGVAYDNIWSITNSTIQEAEEVEGI